MYDATRAAPGARARGLRKRESKGRVGLQLGSGWGLQFMHGGKGGRENKNSMEKVPFGPGNACVGSKILRLEPVEA